MEKNPATIKPPNDPMEGLNERVQEKIEAMELKGTVLLSS